MRDASDMTLARDNNNNNIGSLRNRVHPFSSEFRKIVKYSGVAGNVNWEPFSLFSVFFPFFSLFFPFPSSRFFLYSPFFPSFPFLKSKTFTF